jgi:bifunctional non-homologous end joining protein LigD
LAITQQAGPILSRALRFITPCLPTVAPKPPIGPGWVHEIKHDGYRLQVHVREGRVRLFTRTGVDW